jgi:Terminase large subunit, T4likevirus-type, N-terminal
VTSLTTLRKEFEGYRAARGRHRGRVPDDPVGFAETVGFEPDDWQAEILLREEHPRKLLLCGRQTGKTSVAALLGLHKALTRPASTVLIVAPTERQAKIAFSHASTFYRRAGAPIGLRSDRRTGMELHNGSVVECMAAIERTVRGHSIDLLICDEAAAIMDHDYHGILPGLIATRGEQILLSTPRGRRGFFHERWSSEDEGWFKRSVRSDEVDRIRAEDLETFRRVMPLDVYEQEFELKWLDTAGGLFSYSDIERALEAGEEIEAIKFKLEEE